MITFQLESWEQYFSDPEREGLWREHYEEFEPAHEHKMPMGPDVELYSAAARLGQLLILVARKEGKMVGYCLVFVRRHIHYASLCAFEDSYFLTKTERRGRTRIDLIKMTIEACRQRGAVRLYFMTKEFLSISRILKYLDFAPIDTVHAIWLEKK